MLARAQSRLPRSSPRTPQHWTCPAFIYQSRRWRSHPLRLKWPIPKIELPPQLSESAELQDLLRKLGQSKWGFVVYRCTYSDQPAWLQLQKKFQEFADESREYSDTPEIYEGYSLTYIEDPALEGSSRHDLRQRFKAWREETIAREKPGALEDGNGYVTPRFEYFLQIDEESLQSMTYEIPRFGHHIHGYCNVVRVNWEPDDYNTEDMSEDELLELEEFRKKTESIDGCRDEDVGWQKLWTVCFPATLYNDLSWPENWGLFYVRPPRVGPS